MIFAPNHTSHLDGVLVHEALPHKIRTKTVQGAAADLWGKKRWKRFVAHYILSAYLLPREGAVQEGIEKTAQFLDKGFNVIIFPEGELSPTGELLPFKGGVGFLATTMRVPVVPVYISGAFEIWKRGENFTRRRGRAKVFFGEPIYLNPKTPHEKATKIIQDKVLALKPNPS